MIRKRVLLITPILLGFFSMFYDGYFAVAGQTTVFHNEKELKTYFNHISISAQNRVKPEGI